MLGISVGSNTELLSRPLSPETHFPSIPRQNVLQNSFLMADDPIVELESLRKQLQDAREEAERERKARKDADEREQKAREEADERERKARQEAERKVREEERERALELIEKILRAPQTQRTPSPTRSAFDPHKQTPRSHSTSNLYNTSETRKQIDDALKAELRNSLILDHPKLASIFFPTTDSTISIFEACKQGRQPLFQDKAGWVDWPQTANELGVLYWFQGTFNHIRQLAADNGLITQGCRNILTAPGLPLDGHIAQRKLDIGLVHGTQMRVGYHSNHNTSHQVSERCNWSQMLVVGELKQNPKMDTNEGTWLDLSRYARVVFKEQDLRQFVLGFTLCGPQMRLWYFDRVGGVASPTFNINEDGQTFVSVISGFLAMDERQFGYDPSIMTDEHGSFVTITRNASKERVDLIRLIKRQSGIVGRATTCWEGLVNGMSVCVKDSWQYPERPDEGDLLKLVTERGARNVARYYHHETIKGIHENPRSWFGDAAGRDAFESEARNAPLAEKLQSTASSASRKRSRDSRDSLDSPHPTKKRSLLHAKGDVCNREHRRLITLDVGKDIRNASSRVALIQGVIGSISSMVESQFLQHLLTLFRPGAMRRR